MADKTAKSEKTRTLLQEHFDTLRAEVDEADARIAPLKERRNELQASITDVEAEMRDLAQQVKAIEAETTLYDKKMELAELARALGAKSFKLGHIGSDQAPEGEPVPEDAPAE